MNVETTIGAKFVTKEVVSRGVTVHLMMWDTAGQERYISLTPMYLMNCSGIVVGYDITSKESLRVAANRYCDLKTNYPNAVIMVIGNKADLECDRRVSLEEGEALANTLHASLFFESKKILLHSFLLVFSHFFLNRCVCTASAMTGANVNRSMEALLDKILETMGY